MLAAAEKRFRKADTDDRLVDLRRQRASAESGRGFEVVLTKKLRDPALQGESLRGVGAEGGT